MNYKMIRYTLGWLLLFETAFFLIPLLTAAIYGEGAVFSFLWSMLITGAVGALFVFKKPKNSLLYAKEGFLIVALSWICLSIFGSLPFMFSGVTTSFVDAFFESASGFTTTGASVFNVDLLPKSIIMWRSFSHWVGGMGVLVFVMAFLPLGGAHNINIMRAESTGPSVSKLAPHIKTTALILYVIYFGMTLVQFILLLFGDISVFEALNIAFSTAGTGGFGTRADSLASTSSYVQIVTTVFMLVFSVNFGSYYLAMRGKFKEAFNNSEIKVFFTIVIVAISLITADTLFSDVFDSFGEALKHSSFTVASIISTTGFASYDFNLWNNLSKTVIVMIMFVGACAGSTGGGIKVSRIIILVKGMFRELTTCIHPRQVKKISIDKRKVDHEVVRSVNAYIVCFVAVFAISSLCLSFEETDLVTNFTAVTAAMNNIGPGLEGVGPMASFAGFTPFSKLILIFDMLAGRLELFPMLILFAPSTWKKQ